MTDLFVEITYPIDYPNDFKIESNVKGEKVPDIISEFLHGQVGLGKDRSDIEDRDVYHIRIDVDLSYDVFTVRDDAGNKSLRDGILIDVLERLNER